MEIGSSIRSRKIKELRSFLDISMASFGKVIGYSASHISKFEKGIVEPSDAALEAICSGFDVKPEYFTDPGMDAADAQIKPVKKRNIEGVGARLKAAREMKGLKQSQLAESVGVVQPVISRLESSNTISDKLGRRLAEILECGYDWLMYGLEGRRDYPVELLTDWLWDHPEIRADLWERMKEVTK